MADAPDDRDWTAFGEPPAHARRVDIAPPPATPIRSEPIVRPARVPRATRRASAPAADLATPTAVWIPTALHEYLRGRANQEGISKTTIFTNGFEACYDRLSAGDLAQETGHRRVLPARTTRRRGKVDQGTQFALYLTDAERNVIDELAGKLNLSRSALVTAVLELLFRDGAAHDTSNHSDPEG
jgi:hypothetical protein